MDRIPREVEQRFSDWQRSLINKNDAPAEHLEARQQLLDEAVRQGPDAFAQYLRTELGVDHDLKIDAPRLHRELTPFEFRDPSFHLERELTEAWTGNVTPGEASRPVYWTLCHIAWLESGFLGNQIDVALLMGDRDGTAEARTRNCLRRLGGLADVRGKVSVLVNCPLSRGWWRGHVARNAAAHSEGALTAEQAHRVLHASNSAWENLAGDSVHRITVANRPEYRAALLHQYLGHSRESGGLNADEVQRTAQVMARSGGRMASDRLSWPDLVLLATRAAQVARIEVEAEARNKAEQRLDGETKPDTKNRGRWPRWLRSE